jgi:preprotein translocase subunit SecG
MQTAIYTLYILNCFFLIMVVLLQAGRGGGLVAGGSGGASGQMLGASGASSFMQRLTMGSAGAFMLLSLLISYMSSTPGGARGAEYLEDLPQTAGSLTGESPAGAPPVEEPTGPPTGEANVPGGEEPTTVIDLNELMQGQPVELNTAPAGEAPPE